MDEDPKSAGQEEIQLTGQDERVRADILVSMLAAWSELEREISRISEEAPGLFDEDLSEASATPVVASRNPAAERKTASKDAIDGQ